MFSKQAVSFLGYRISTSGVVMECARVTAVRNWPTPTTVKEVQRFLGFANYYRRFIPGFGQVVAPITSLLKGGPARLRWSAEAGRAFRSEGAVHQCARVVASGPLFSVHSGGGHVRGGGRGRAVPALGLCHPSSALVPSFRASSVQRSETMTWGTGSC